LIETTGQEGDKPAAAMTAEQLMAAQRLVRRLPVGDSVVEAILDLVRAARPDSSDSVMNAKLAWGAGPRASQSLALAVRARALLQGRLAPSVDDVAALAAPILKHRIALNFGARADGESVDAVIKTLIGRLG
ncbi:MAG: AAA family ATPase, partial [Bosea sp. (in: a-proteobacteria)]